MLAATGCLVASLLATTAVAASQLTTPPSLPDQVQQEYRIQIGDELDIKFFFNPELNETVIVRPDGRISLQLIPEVVAANVSPAALAAELTKRYAGELKQSRVTVIVRQFGAQRIFVDGEVARPGMVAMSGPMTISQAISQAGGTKETARLSEVIVIRRTDDKLFAFQVNLKSVRTAEDLRQDAVLVPFDIVFVPRSRIANMNVWVDQYLRKNIPIPFGLQFGVYP